MSFGDKYQELTPGQEVVISDNTSSQKESLSTNYQTQYHRQYSKKKVRVSIYFTKDNHRRLKKAATRNKLPVATFSRGVILSQLEKEPFLSTMERELFAKVTFRVNKYGNLLNQVVRKINSTGMVGPEDIAIIQDNQKTLFRIIQEMIKKPD